MCIMDEITDMLSEIESLQKTLKHHYDIKQQKQIMTFVISICTLHLIRIYHKTNGLQRSLHHITGHDILLLVYMSALKSCISHIV